MWAYSDCGELDLGFIPGKNHAPPLPFSLGTAEVGGAYRKPGSSVKSQSALLCVGKASSLLRWETDEDGSGLKRHRGKARRPQPAIEGREFAVGVRVSPRHLVLNSPPVRLPMGGKSRHWEERIGLHLGGTRGIFGMAKISRTARETD